MTAFRIPARDPKWWQDRREIARVARWLADEGADAETMFRLIDEPWHFEMARNEMIRVHVQGRAA